jgi:hypothetical protein
MLALQTDPRTQRLATTRMATETHLYFDLPRGGRFPLLAAWWVEAGMNDFQRETEAYAHSVYPAVQLIALTDIEPPLLGPGRARLTDSGFDYDRMMLILRGIASKRIIPPVQMTDQQQQGEYRYKVYDGWHRFYASVAAGFPCLPTVTVSGWKPDTPAINEPRV